MMYSLLRPLLFSLPPEIAHALTMRLANLAHRLHLLSVADLPADAAVELMGLKFANRVGLAAGFDKDGRCIDALGAMGFAFLELGTVTPRAQVGNPSPRVFRLVRERALINRLGFPNKGVDSLCERLMRRNYAGICGVNIGKNATTPLTEAAADYRYCLRIAYPFADYIAVNISSPNTLQLRALQRRDSLQPLLDALVKERSLLRTSSNRYVPIVIKLTADLSSEDLADAARCSLECGIDGIIATNTTVSRDSVSESTNKIDGGLSGTPLLPRALNAVRCIRDAVGARYPIIGVGGIQSLQDAMAMRSAGADLIQIYTGLIYRGPDLVRKIATALR